MIDGPMQGLWSRPPSTDVHDYLSNEQRSSSTLCLTPVEAGFFDAMDSTLVHMTR